MPGDTHFATTDQGEAVAGAAACRVTVLNCAPGSVAAHEMAVGADRGHDTLAPAA
jgi:hypothetical protein